MSDNRIVKVAAVQDSPVFLNKEATVEKVCRLIKEAASKGAKLVVFPETFLSGYPDWVWLLPAAKKDDIQKLYRRLFESAVSIDDEAVKQIGAAAGEESVFVCIGANEKNSEASKASLFNSLFYFGSDGQLMGVHRKLIPTGGERLMWAQGGGESLLSFETEIGQIGGLICWENYMPLARNSMYMAGVEIYVAPTWDSSPTWQTAMKHIAREGGMYVIGCSPAMKMSDVPDELDYKSLYPNDREWVNKGNSCIVDPVGNYICEPVEAEQTILYADLDLNRISDQKWIFDVAGHYSRPDVFEYRIKR